MLFLAADLASTAPRRQGWCKIDLVFLRAKLRPLVREWVKDVRKRKRKSRRRRRESGREGRGRDKWEATAKYHHLSLLQFLLQFFFPSLFIPSSLFLPFYLPFIFLFSPGGLLSPSFIHIFFPFLHFHSLYLPSLSSFTFTLYPFFFVSTFFSLFTPSPFLLHSFLPSSPSLPLPFFFAHLLISSPLPLSLPLIPLTITYQFHAYMFVSWGLLGAQVDTLNLQVKWLVGGGREAARGT